MRLKFSIAAFLVVLFSWAQGQSLHSEYAEGWLSLKVNSELRSNCYIDRIANAELTKLFERLGVDQFEKRFPHAEPFVAP